MTNEEKAEQRDQRCASLFRLIEGFCGDVNAFTEAFWAEQATSKRLEMAEQLKPLLEQHSEGIKEWRQQHEQDAP